METSRRSVAQLRQERRLTVQQLAELSAIPDRILRLIERRHYLPSSEQIERLCSALGVASDDLDVGLPATRPGIYGTGGTFM